MGAAEGNLTGPLKQHAGLKHGFGSIGPLLPVFTSFYIIITCYYGNDGSVITYLGNIITSLLCMNTPCYDIIITCYYGNNVYYYVLLL